MMAENKGYTKIIDRKGKSRAMDTSSTRTQEKTRRFRIMQSMTDSQQLL